MMKPSCSNTNMKKLHRSYSECTYCNFNTLDNIYCDIIEYYPICVYVNYSAKTNF